MYFLLDTNILISLISEPREEHLLNRLKWLIEAGEIQLLVPEILLKEWNKKKAQTVAHITRTFSTSSKHSHNKSLNSQFQDDLSIVNEKLKKVDSYLSKGISIPLIQKVKVLTIDRSTEGKAPFHGDKTKSLNDALIYFSTIEFVERKKVQEFVFVTKDVGDYGDPVKKGEAIHPDLLVSSINILFFPALGKCLPELIESGKISFQKNIDDSVPRYGINVINQWNKNLLDHLYDVLTECQKIMKFIPPDIFCRIHPFRIRNIKHNYSYYGNFILHTNNSELIDFFKEVDVDKCKFNRNGEYRNIKQNLLKLKYVLEVLNQQLVFFISGIGTADEVKIRPQTINICNCPRCLYTRLEWNDFLNMNVSENEALKMAYVNFQLGFFAKAFSGYYEKYKQAKEVGNKVQSYQLLYILKWVSNYATLKTNEATNKIAKEVELMDGEEEYFSFANAPKLDREIARFLHNGNIMLQFGSEVKKHVEKIREHYNSQLRANYSSNSNYWNLVGEFSVFEMFTLSNSMAYTKFSDFDEICKDFTEGIFLSIALNQYQVSRIIHFDDYILKSLLFYGSADHMIRLYNGYIKKDIPYLNDDSSFKRVVENFLSNSKELIIHFEEEDAWQGSTHFYNTFWNLLLLLALVKFEDGFVILCFDKIIPYLSILPKRETRKLNHLSSLIQAKGKILGRVRLENLFFMCLSNPQLHNEDLFDAFASFSKKGEFAPVTTKERFGEFCEYFLDKCEKCNEYHQNIVFTGYPLLSNEFKIKLSASLNSKLQQKLDYKVYYLASIFGIIDYLPLFKEYLNLFILPEKGKRRPFDHLDGEIKYRELNNLMNLVFKYNIRLPRKFITRLRGISDYYDWLLNMKDFNYDRFNPLWIIQYPTQYYLERIFSFKPIREKVRTYLKKNHQPTLAFYYSQHVK